MSIEFYDLVNDKKINEIKNAHNNNIISNFRHFFDKIYFRDLILSISCANNNIKVWDIKNLECLTSIYAYNKGFSYSSCFLYDNNKNYIIASNINPEGNTRPLKVFDFKGKQLYEINESNDLVFFIDNYYDKKLSKNFIITGNEGYCKSYDFYNNKMYHKYFTYKPSNTNPNKSIIIYEDEEIVKLIELGEIFNIRIFNFHSGELLDKININKYDANLCGICMWNNEYLFIGTEGDILYLIDLKNKKIIKEFINKSRCGLSIKKINIPKYGQCIITQEILFSKIKLWGLNL